MIRKLGTVVLILSLVLWVGVLCLYAEQEKEETATQEKTEQVEQKVQIKPKEALKKESIILYGHENKAVFKLPEGDMLKKDDQQKLISPYAFESTYSQKDSEFYSLFSAVDITDYGYNNPPYEPSNPDPRDGATNVPTDSILTWVGGDPDSGDTVYYDVYFEKDNPNPQVLVKQGITVTTYDPNEEGGPGLDRASTYYWKIIAEDDHGAVTPGRVWAFSTEGSVPDTPTPTPTGQTPVVTPTPTVTPTAEPAPDAPVLDDEPPYTAGTTNTLSWSKPQYAHEFKIECHKRPDMTDLVADSGWITQSNYTFTNLQDSTTYFYRVKARNNARVESAWSNRVSSTQDASKPKIYLAGYLNTNVSQATGGVIEIGAYVMDNIGVDNVEVYYDKSPTGLFLPEVAQKVYITTLNVGPGAPAGQYLLQVVATDNAGNESFMWPYLYITEQAQAQAAEAQIMRLAEPMLAEDVMDEEHPWQVLLQASIEGLEAKAGERPRILAGGYWDTYLSEEAGGKFNFVVAVNDPNGWADISIVEIYFGGHRTGVFLKDDGTQGDMAAGDGLFTFSSMITQPLGEGTAGEYLLTVVATDLSGNTSFTYPFLRIQ